MAKRKRKSQEVQENQSWKYLAWAVGLGAWLLVAAALFSFDPADPPNHHIAPHNEQPANWIGRFGAVLSYHLFHMLGPGVWIILAGWMTLQITTALGRTVNQLLLRASGIIIMSIAFSAMIRLGSFGIISGAQHPEGVGGLVAIFIDAELVERFNLAGTFVILVVAFWIGAILAIDQVVMALPRVLGGAAQRIFDINIPRPVLVGRLPSLAFFTGWLRSRGEQQAVASRPPAEKIPLRHSGNRGGAVDDDAIDEDAGGLGATESFDPDAHRRTPATPAPNLDLEDDEDDDALVEPDDTVDDPDDAEHDAPGTYLESKQRFDPEKLRAKMQQMPINFPTRAKPTPIVPQEVDLSGYQFPGMDLLIEPESDFNEEIERIVRDQAMTLEAALEQYRIDGEVVGIDSGPVITMYEVRLAPGTKVSSLNAVSSDLARSLKAPNVRIVANIVGRDTVGIEVPNIKKEKVRLKELMHVDAEAISKMRLPMFLGKDASGNPLNADLTTMPHMLIAGTTGSGKSVCMNSIIMSFLYTKRPDELKLVLVDPKMVEMSQFKDIPHLMCPVVTEMSKAASILEWAVTKMDERYELLAEAGVRDIASYNGLGWEELKERMQPAGEAEEARIPKKLPYMVFIIDELADLMMTNKEVENFIVRIAQKARAVGIHLILATQRPQANVVTGLIKSNMPCRVSFKVASGMDSRIVLDSKGAELLLGQGDMLYLSPRTSKLTRAQGTLVDDGEIRQTVKFLKTIAQQNFEPQLVQIKSAGVSDEAAEERDPLFEDAVRVVLETQRGSVSLLQRRLTIGYSRASRLVEQIAEAGLIGEYRGAQAREVVMTLEEYDAMMAQAQADAAAHGPAAPSQDDDDPGQDDIVDEDDEAADDVYDEDDQAYDDDEEDEDEVDEDEEQDAYR